MTTLRLALAAAVTSACLAASTKAHTTFILPEVADDAPPRVRLIFSETLEAEDGRAAKEKLPLVKLHTRTATGEVTDLAHEEAEASRLATLPDAGPRVVFGLLAYGTYVSFRADPPMTYLLSYYPKAVIGPWTEESAVRLGESQPVELVPVLQLDGSVMFRFEVEGSPTPGIDVTVRTPDGESRKVKTDDAGLTPAFGEPGRYGVTGFHRIDTPGEHEGEPYDALMRGASLVIDLP